MSEPLVFSMEDLGRLARHLGVGVGIVEGWLALQATSTEELRAHMDRVLEGYAETPTSLELADDAPRASVKAAHEGPALTDHERAMLRLEAWKEMRGWGTPTTEKVGERELRSIEPWGWERRKAAAEDLYAWMTGVPGPGATSA